MTVTVHIIMFIITSASLSPLLYLLLFSGGMLVFLMFCSLLMECKLNFNSSLYLFFMFPVMQMFLNPLHSSILTYSLMPNMSVMLILPSLLLMLFSVSNLEMSFRN